MPTRSSGPALALLALFVGVVRPGRAAEPGVSRKESVGSEEGCPLVPAFYSGLHRGHLVQLSLYAREVETDLQCGIPRGNGLDVGCNKLQEFR